MRLAAVVNNKQVKADPTIVDFNTHQHFLRIVIQALSEYVAEISATGTHYGACQQFLRDAERNLSIAYIVFFSLCLVSNFWITATQYDTTNRGTSTCYGKRILSALGQHRQTKSIIAK